MSASTGPEFDSEAAESYDEALPLVSQNTTMTQRINGSRISMAMPNIGPNFNNNSNATQLIDRRKSVAAIQFTSAQNTSLQKVDSVATMPGSSFNALAPAKSPPIVDPTNPLYETLMKSLSKRRQSMAKINATTTSLLIAAPSIMGPATKKSVNFSDFVQTSDGDQNRIEEQDEEDQQCEDDDEEQRKQTIDQMKRKKDAAASGRVKKYGYDPLNPPLPRTWAQWSIQRRDYQSALAEVLQCQRQPQLSKAALKGRKDSIAFVKEDMVDAHLLRKPGEGSNLLTAKTDKEETQKKEAKKPKKEKSASISVRSRHHHAQLSDMEIEILNAYYCHPLFGSSRAAACMCDFTAMILIIIAVAIPIWVEIPYKIVIDPKTKPAESIAADETGPEYIYQMTMFLNCTVLSSEAKESSFFADLKHFASDLQGHSAVAATGLKELEQQLQNSKMEHKNPTAANNATGTALASTDLTQSSPINLALETTTSTNELFGNHTFECIHYSFGTWQSFLLGVMGFALMFSIFGCFFLMSGTCSTSVLDKLYYYHSSAEMLIVSGILTGLAVTGFPLCLRYKVEILDFTYGQGYYIGMTSAAGYIIAGFLLNLDSIMMSLVPETKRKRKK